nr:MAG TPA: deoxyuridine 5'-triphosphate nucleotidohydrolase [Caudoviricetes sp.]
MNIRFARVRPDAKIPSKRDEDAGYDLWPCFENDWIEIQPFESKLIPTGIASAIESNYAFIFRERGSTGTKNIKVNAGVIDSGFNGEWFVSIYNANKIPLFISKFGTTGEQSPITEHPDAILYPYDKAIAQAILIQVPRAEIEEVNYSEIANRNTERGTGQLGSTN